MKHTRVTASLRLPVSVAWKCMKCGTYNVENGLICVESRGSISTTADKRVKEEEQKQKSIVESKWKDIALKIINDPIGNMDYLRFNLWVDGKCKECGHRSLWAFNDSSIIFAICGIIFVPLMFALLFGVYEAVFGDGFPRSYILTMVVCITIYVILGFVEERINKKAAQIREECRPYIVTANKELNAYAKAKGKIIYTNAALDVFSKGVDRRLEVPVGSAYENEIDTRASYFNPEETALAGNNTEQQQNTYVQTESNKIMFCRKCGTKLRDGAVFCDKCGTKVKK